MKGSKVDGLGIPLDINDLNDVYNAWKSSVEPYGCNVYDNKYHGKVICPEGGCPNCILDNRNKKKFISYMQTKGEHIPLNECFNKENKMNKNISEVFDKTEDALLVEKHLGNQLGTTFIDGLILADKKTEVLAEAKRLEKEEKDNK